MIVMALWGCEKDAAEAVAPAEALLTFTAEIPQELQKVGPRAAIGSGSQHGGLNNVDWNTHQLRYIMEVYDPVDMSLVTREVKYKTTNAAGAAKSENFSVRLIPNKEYKAVFWADFILQGSNADLYYQTVSETGLQAVTLLNGNAYVGNDDARDAYFAQENIKINGNETRAITLKRPFGKLRVITTDADALVSAGVNTVRVAYTTALPTGFNAATGNLISGQELQDATYEAAVSVDGNEGTDANSGKLTVAFDYIFVPSTTAEAPLQVAHNLRVAVCKDDAEISSYAFTTGIPIERNKLTTVRGNLFTSQLGISVSVSDAFDGEIVIGEDELNTIGYVDLGEVDWEVSNVWKIMDGNTQVGEIAREGFSIGYKDAYQVVAAYPMAGADPDLEAGLITGVLSTSTSKDITELAGGSIAWNPRAAADDYGYSGKVLKLLKSVSLGAEANFTQVKVMKNQMVKAADVTDLKKLSLEPYTVTDIDGNTYPVAKLGASYWLRENLRVKHYNDGTALQDRRTATAADLAEVPSQDGVAKFYEAAPLYDWYQASGFDAGASEATRKLYGLSYNFRAVAGDDDPWLLSNEKQTVFSLAQQGDPTLKPAETNKQLCPEGWHVATYSEGFGYNMNDMFYADMLFGFKWWGMMTANYVDATDPTGRDLNTAQWFKSGSYVPMNLSGLSINAVPALGQTTGFKPTTSLKMEGGELQGIPLFWTSWLVKDTGDILSASVLLDTTFDMLGSNNNSGVMGRLSLPVRCVRN